MNLRCKSLYQSAAGIDPQHPYNDIEQERDVILTAHHTAQRPSPCRRPALPAGFSDLSGASGRLATAAAVLPEQFFVPTGGSDSRHGEVALMRAVLEDAVHCLQQQSCKSGRRA
jgi:hypothetical protein